MAVGVIGTGSCGLLTSCSGGNKGKGGAATPLREPGSYYIPELPDLATDGKELKAGVVGCGGRGSGAAINFLNAANGVTIVALGDVFQDRVDSLAEKLKSDKNIEIPADKRFVVRMLQAVIDSDIACTGSICTPPCFRAEHFKYAEKNNTFP